VTSFKGVAVDSTTLLVAYVYSGDANLDGGVDTVDFNLLASNFSRSGKRWFNGDFNYDGSVDTTDFNLLASNFGQTIAAQAATPGTLVPEPAGAGLALFPFISIALQRRRKSV
jgi:hypothetical protein